jgi:hypothetical protein
MKREALRLLLVTGAIILGAFCAKDEGEWQGTIEKINGVSVVSNPAEPIYEGAVMSLKDPLRIGVASGKEEYMLQEIGALEVDDTGRMYISDWKESHVKIFDQNGAYLKTLGRKGQGPGEFERINRLQIVNHNNLVIFDGNVKRLSVFSLEGEFEKAIPIQKTSPLDVFIDSKGNLLVKTVQLDPVSAKAAIGIRLYDLDMNLIKVLASDDPQDVLIPFRPYFVWGLAADIIILGRNEKYSFSLYDSKGEILKTINRDYQAVPISAEEKKTQLKKLQQPQNMDVPTHYPAYQSIMTDGEKRIIVRTYEKLRRGKGQYYDVFDFEGRYLARISLEYPPRIWRQNKLYMIEEDEEGFQYLMRYTVDWKI